MKRGAIKILAVILCIISCLPFVVGCSCLLPDFPPANYVMREVGDFVACFYADFCEIVGFTEQGNSKKYIVIPEYIDGIPVISFGHNADFALLVVQIDSDVLEKVYFESPIKANYSTFGGYNSVKKVMYPKVTEFSLNGFYGVDTYFPIKDFIENGGGGFITHGANISYYYNYENESDDEYYWIDDCDYGGIIEFIPPDPEREGYIFGGWYKEPECINEWDFETDTLPEEKTEMKEYSGGEVREEVVYQETILYAKWDIDPERGEDQE